VSNHTHQTAPTQFVEAAGIRFAYRRFANRQVGVTTDIPLLFFMHFSGTMDHWLFLSHATLLLARDST
jgi:hypothetical protein